MKHLFVIHRREEKLFHYLRATFVHEPEVAVLLDRRVGERRQREGRARPSPLEFDRRACQRRRPMPGTWEPLGYIFVAGEADEGSAMSGESRRGSITAGQTGSAGYPNPASR